jgi:hypothetical protein
MNTTVPLDKMGFSGLIGFGKLERPTSLLTNPIRVLIKPYGPISSICQSVAIP